MASAQELPRRPSHYQEREGEPRDRRTQMRDGVVSRIEDTTYAILRKHEKKSA
jgi:hypothetical protein